MKYIEIHGQTVAMAEFLPAQASSNPPWILIHGAGHDHGVWTELAQGLSAAGDHLIAPDLPGHGHSAGAPIADIAGMVMDKLTGRWHASRDVAVNYIVMARKA